MDWCEVFSIIITLADACTKLSRWSNWRSNDTIGSILVIFTLIRCVIFDSDFILLLLYGFEFHKNVIENQKNQKKKEKRREKNKQNSTYIAVYHLRE